MKVHGNTTRSIRVEPDGWWVGVIDQTALPYRFATAAIGKPPDSAKLKITQR